MDFTESYECPEAYGFRGLTYRAKGEYDLAISDFTKTLEINPDFAEPYDGRRWADYSIGEYARCLEDTIKAQKLDCEIPPEFLDGLRNALGKRRL